MTESTPSALLLAPLHLTLGVGALVVAAAAVPFWLPALLEPRAQPERGARLAPAPRAAQAATPVPATPTMERAFVGAA